MLMMEPPKKKIIRKLTANEPLSENIIEKLMLKTDLSLDKPNINVDLPKKKIIKHVAQPVNIPDKPLIDAQSSKNDTQPPQINDESTRCVAYLMDELRCPNEIISGRQICKEHLMPSGKDKFPYGNIFNGYRPSATKSLTTKKSKKPVIDDDMVPIQCCELKYRGKSYALHEETGDVYDTKTFIKAGLYNKDTDTIIIFEEKNNENIQTSP